MSVSYSGVWSEPLDATRWLPLLVLAGDWMGLSRVRILFEVALQVGVALVAIGLFLSFDF